MELISLRRVYVQQIVNPSVLRDQEKPELMILPT